MLPRKKLIEVALPLEAINRESAREKYICQGNPSTIHKWWAQRPLAACRAVLFASFVDDPESDPDAQARGDPDHGGEAGELVDADRRAGPVGELEQPRRAQSRAGRDRPVHRLAEDRDRSGPRTGPCQGRRPGTSAPACKAPPEAVNAVLAEHAPPVYDPFCGGGSIPLEAQRLGLRAFASDLNPVPVLITKALIEIPPRFAGQPPVNPEARKRLKIATYRGAQGLAEDVRYYGRWMRRSREEDRPPVPEGQDHARDGPRPRGSKTLRRAGTEGHRLAVGADGR